MKIVILGGGPSGLGVAWGLVERGHKDIVIVERNAQLGGLSGSFKVGGSTLDFGPHRFSPEFPDLVEKIKAVLGDDLLEVSNEHAVVFRNRVYRYPPVISDFLNWPTVWTSCRVVASFIWERTKFWAKKITGQKAPAPTFENIIVSRFGRELYEKVVRPIALKVWGEPSSLDPEFANLRFSVPTIVQWGKKLLGTKDTFNDKVFFYPRLGFQQIWDRLGEELKKNGVEILLNCKATEIEVKDGQAVSVKVEGEGQKQHFATSYVVSTIPTQQFVRILKPNPLLPADLLMKRFDNRGMILVYFLAKKSESLPARVVIAPESKYLFNRLSEQNQFSRDTVPAGKSAVLADVLADVGSVTWNLSDEVILKTVATQIADCGFIQENEIEEAKVFRVPVAYPLPTSARELEQKKFNDAISQVRNVVCTGRFASSDYNNCHTALHKGLLAAAAITENVGTGEWYRMADGLRKTAIRD